MKHNWNIVQLDNSDVKLIWKDVNTLSYDEIKEMEKELNNEPYFCKKTQSIVFETNENMEVPKNVNYSELKLISRYINKDYKLNDVL